MGLLTVLRADTGLSDLLSGSTAPAFVPLLEGFAIGFGLIVTIGAQGLFVLRQGLANEHLLIVCLLCSLSDFVLITSGIFGFSQVNDMPRLTDVLTYGGAAFLVCYGYGRIRSGVTMPVLTTVRAPSRPLQATVMTCLALTWLNPHVYVDTVFLIGGLANRHAAADRLAFGAGACIASFAFFFALGYGARLLASMFQKTESWRALDLVGGFVMWVIAGSLLFRAA